MKHLRFYRANKNNSGFASSWELSFKEQNKYDPWMMFLRMAPQTGYDQNDNGVFDWEGQGITVKLGENDIGEILAVLQGRKQSAGYKDSLFHQTPGGGSKTIKFTYDEQSNAYGLQVTSKDKDGKLLGPYRQMVSASEGCLLEVLLKQGIVKMYGWE